MAGSIAALHAHMSQYRSAKFCAEEPDFGNDEKREIHRKMPACQ